ncbi:MAG: response regulator [Planctomycetes bacterium]|nr:response regulator [Planctomycetota bacterium]
MDGFLDLLDQDLQKALARLESREDGPDAPVAREPRAARRIALVDDNADNRLLVRAILGARYELLEHGTAFDALAALQEVPVELFLIDISLPGMDGVELLSRIRENPRMARTPAIALTAHAMAGDRERFLAAGFEEHVTKPIVDEGILLGAIERLLGART